MCSPRLTVAVLSVTLLTACVSVAPGLPELPPTTAEIPAPYARTDTTGIATPRTAPAAPLAASPDAAPDAASRAVAARIGSNDLLDIALLEAPELNRIVRVAETGKISLPLVGEVTAAGRTPRELEVVLEDSLRQRYVRDPHVSVQLTEMQSHGIAVVGAVARPGVFQVREPQSLLDVIALAGGFNDRAGGSVLVLRGGSATTGAAAGNAAPAEAPIEIRFKELLDSGDPRHNVMVNPGDLVKVTPAGVVYVVGEVRKPGAFPLEHSRGLTVLQAVALGEGLAPRASRSRTVIIRTTERGDRVQIPVDLGDVLAGRAADPVVQARDVVFVPNSALKTVTLGTIDAVLRLVTLRAVF